MSDRLKGRPSSVDGAINNTAEFFQLIDKGTIVVALGGVVLGIISAGFAVALTTASVFTYFIAEAVKRKE
jgi:hypothetical protein